MAETSSYGAEPDAITAIDGVITRSNDITVTYESLSVPAGATVSGIVVTWTGGYSSDVNPSWTVMSVGYSGSEDGEPLAPNQTPATYSDIETITFGEPTSLWGLTWSVDQANAIFTKMSTETGTFYHDAFQVTIHYTVGTETSNLSVSQGKIILPQGKITIS